MLLLLLLVFAACKQTTFNDFFGGKNIIPAILADAPSGAVLYTLRMMVGSPPIMRRFVADFEAKKLVLSNRPQLLPDAVLVRVGAHRMLMDYYVDPHAAAEIGCPECDGVFPLGSGSPLWLIYRNVSITTGAVYLEDRFEPKMMKCITPVPEFCILNATILGFPTEVHIVPNQAETILPGKIYRAYEEDRALATTPAYEWEDLKIDFGESEITIPSSIIYQKAFGESPRLMIKLAPSGQNHVVIGTSALRAFEVYRDWNRNAIGFRNWKTERSYGLPSLFAMLLLMVGFFRWLESPPLYRVTGDLFRDNPIRIGIDMILEMLVLFAPAFFLLTEGTYSVLLNDPYLSAVIGIMVVFLFGWGAFVQIMFWGNAPERIGFLTRKSMHGPPRIRANLPSRDLPIYVNIGLARLRQIREYVYEISILLSVFFIAIEVRQDTLGSFIGLVVYLGCLLVMIYHTVVCFRITRGWQSMAWYLFTISSFVINIFFILGMHTSVFVPGMRKYIPRDDEDLLVTNIFLHLLFIGIIFDYSTRKTHATIEYISKNAQNMHYN